MIHRNSAQCHQRSQKCMCFNKQQLILWNYWKKILKEVRVYEATCVIIDASSPNGVVVSVIVSVHIYVWDTSTPF